MLARKGFSDHSLHLTLRPLLYRLLTSRLLESRYWLAKAPICSCGRSAHVKAQYLNLYIQRLIRAFGDHRHRVFTCERPIEFTGVFQEHLDQVSSLNSLIADI